MNKVLSTLGAVILACMVCYADAPSKEEVANANAVVTDILAPRIEAMKSGKAKPNEVADYALSLMGEAETSAAKYALAGNAYVYYMRGEDYAKAVEAIGMMREAVPDIPPDRLLKAISPAARGVSANKAPEVHAILTDLQGKVKSQGEITKIKAQLKAAKVSERPLLYRKLGESYAVIGDWKQALENLSKGNGEVVKVTQCEMGNEKSVGKLAGMWWDASEEKGLKSAVALAYRKHAAELYQKGLDDGSISGLSKKLAEQRIEEAQKASCAVLSTETTPKQRVPKGLVHRWSFNGDLKDSIGNVDARLSGDSSVDSAQCHINRRGEIAVPDAVPDYRSNFTIEIWFTERERTNGGRVFKLFSCNNKTGWYDIGWATGSYKDGWLYVNYDKTSKMSECCGFDLGIETYVAMSYKYESDKGYNINGYKYDYKTRRFSTFQIVRKDGEIKPLEYLAFGCSVWPARCPASAASFNECRIWNRALSKSEIERSAKAGPDKFAF